MPVLVCAGPPRGSILPLLWFAPLLVRACELIQIHMFFPSMLAHKICRLLALLYDSVLRNKSLLKDKIKVQPLLKLYDKTTNPRFVSFGLRFIRKDKYAVSRTWTSS